MSPLDAIELLIDLTDDTENTEKLYTVNSTFFGAKNSDFLHSESSRGKWGPYTQKPVAQVQWDQQVRQAAMNICSASDNNTKYDLRPRLFDNKSGLSILLDSGACCSIWPKTHFPDAQLDPNRRLQAVNGTHISTYGERFIKIQPSTTQNRTLTFTMGWTHILH